MPISIFSSSVYDWVRLKSWHFSANSLMFTYCVKNLCSGCPLHVETRLMQTNFPIDRSADSWRVWGLISSPGKPCTPPAPKKQRLTIQKTEARGDATSYSKVTLSHASPRKQYTYTLPCTKKNTHTHTNLNHDTVFLLCCSHDWVCRTASK